MKKPSLLASLVAIMLAFGSTGCSYKEYADAKFQADLVKASSEHNKSLPMMVDSDTRLDTTIAGPGKEWTYMYTLVATDVKGITNEKINAVMGDKLRNSVCTMKEMEIFVRNEVTMKYKYRDNDGNYLGEVVVTPGDCKKLNSQANRPG